MDKPADMGSMTVTTKLRRALGNIKAGHAGTLDPFATGVLPIAFGKATRLIPYLMNHLKTYRFELTFGAETDSGDLTGKITQTSTHRPFTEAILQALPAFKGEICQTPPKYAALHIDGERAYTRARRGEVFEIPTRRVWIEDLRLLNVQEGQNATFEVICGSGTYVRTLGQDLAKKLGTRGHLTQLRRTQVGPFHEKHAISLDSILKIGHDWPDVFYPSQAVLDDIPAFEVDKEQARRLCYGQTLLMEPLLAEGVLKVFCQGHFLGLARCQEVGVVPLQMFKRPQDF